MAHSKIRETQPGNDPDGESMQEINKMFKQEKNDASVKEALKKEKQPVRADDLSHLHNTREVGTSGGDQRASENELEMPEEAI